MPEQNRPVTLRFTFADAHILRAILSQSNYPESWQRRALRELDAAIYEATRDRRARTAA